MYPRSSFSMIITGLILLGITFGCAPRQPIFLTEKRDYRSELRNNATEIEYPNVNLPSFGDVMNPVTPFTLDNATPREEWDMELETAICLALQNSDVVRSLNGVNFSVSGAFGTPGTILSSPGAVQTMYDPAIIETDPRYGIAAALAMFDPILSSQVGWTKQDDYVTSGTSYNPTKSDTGVFQTTISKTAATGGTFYLTNDNRYYDSMYRNYTSKNRSYWASYFEGGFSQPLLRGSGIQFNRIAGPGAIPGFNNGIMIARVNHDISLTSFEIAIRNLVADVEKAYWNLYFAYYSLDSVIAGRDAALLTYERVRTEAGEGGIRGTAMAESQAKTQYLIFQGQVEQAQSNLFKTESALRYILGIGPTDGRLIVPVSEPTIAPLNYDYTGIVAEGLVRSPELRMQKWDVKKKEMELIAQKNYILPKLNLNGNIRSSGLGDKLIDSDDAVSSAYGSMVHDDKMTMGISLNLEVPLGQRQGHAAYRNAQLASAKSRAILRNAESELTHQLGDAYRDVNTNYHMAQTNYDRRVAAKKEVEAVRISYEHGYTQLDQLLDAQRRLAEADTQYYRSLVDYNISISTLHLRKGSLLEYNNIGLAEGPWPHKALNHDAVLQARKRAAGHYMNYGYTSPQAISRGKYSQFQRNDDLLLGGETSYQVEGYELEEGESYIIEEEGELNQPRLAPPINRPVSYSQPKTAENEYVLPPVKLR